MTADREVKVCEHCGKEFGKPKNVSRSMWVERRFCSVKCRASLVRGKSGIRPDEITLRDLYEAQRLTLREIGQRYSSPHISVRRWLRFYGIPARDAHNGLVNRGITPPTRDELYHLIHDERRTYEEVATLYGVDMTAVPYWLKKHGIPPSLNTGTYGNRFVLSDGQPVRSSYERKTGDWLIRNGIRYTYEPLLPFRRFRADFLANGWYIEIWGMEKISWYKERQREKRNLYRSHDLPLIEFLPSHFSSRLETFERRIRKCLSPAPDDLPLLRGLA